MLLDEITVGPFQCHCWILVCEKSGETLIVDPGDEADRISERLKKIEKDIGRKLEIKALFHTHAHLDHIGGTRGLKTGIARTAPILLHPSDDFIYQQLKMQGQLFGMELEDPLPVDRGISDGEILKIGPMKLEVIHTPGHSPGSVGLRLHEDSACGCRETVFSGDTLFQGSVGRTDLWGGDMDQLITSIRERLLVLDDDTGVLPGHGAETTIGFEKRSNPFLI